MKVIDVKELINKLKINETICEVFASKTNKSKEELMATFDHIIDKEINRIGEAMQATQSNPQDTSRLRDLSLDDFMKDNDKIIKDK